MDAVENQQHWKNWANNYQQNLRATSKSQVFKELEIYNLLTALHHYVPDQATSILECGCGNGFNVIEVAKTFPNLQCLGFDFVPEMVKNAEANQVTTEKELGKALNLKFVEGDLRNLDQFKNGFDVIFTNRAIINLASHKEQSQVLQNLSLALNNNGVMILLENSLGSYNRQNNLRESLGLEKRQPAKFNVFVNEDAIIKCLAEAGLELVVMKNIGSLHDTVLYTLLPHLHEGSILYEDPMVKAAKDLEIQACQQSWPNDRFGKNGQVNLFVFKKPRQV